MADKKTLIVIAGPTAVGKTSVAIQLAHHFKTEIVSTDSRQIFKELNIGTAKPSPLELAEIRHYFIDTHSIHDDYDAAQFGRDALQVINDLFKEKQFVILCGGSGLYIKAVIEGFDDIPAVDDTIRERLVQNFEENGIAWLQQEMLALDPDHYHKIDHQNPHRLIRALEVKIGTGKSISEFQQKQKLVHDFNIVKIGLELPREELYQKIDTRMDNMIGAGLFDEAKSFYPLKHLQSLQTVGYQEIFDYLDGQYDYEEAVRILKRNTRRYAKRQLTWFKRDTEMKWFSPDDLMSIQNYISRRLR